MLNNEKRYSDYNLCGHCGKRISLKKLFCNENCKKSYFKNFNENNISFFKKIQKTIKKIFKK